MLHLESRSVALPAAGFLAVMMTNPVCGQDHGDRVRFRVSWIRPLEQN
jgi:hypothetical protein